MNDFYKEKKVLITGHMGFKGTWLCKMLLQAGAKVIGYGLDNGVEPSLYQISEVEKQMVSIEGDVRDFEHMREVFEKHQPEIVFHLAAQPIVLEAYRNPVYTYDTNVMGTVHLMECVRLTQSVESVVNVTTDKVYENLEEQRPFVEGDRINGIDPYSNSKSCSELVTDSYVRSFFQTSGRKLSVSTVRAGNVLGGGDFSKDRIIPDCVRASVKNQVIHVRNPHSVRPYQHVLEALNVYLLIAEKQWGDSRYAGHYNVGPGERDCLQTGELVTIFCSIWGENATWHTNTVQGPKEAGCLTLNCDKLREAFDWKPVWNIYKTLEATVEWHKAYRDRKVMPRIMEAQIKDFYQGETRKENDI